ncbi:probable jasmonic acid carboxyl methyltransferase 2, partial [Impatiens glandulifera]|uniref:probable jasmonic acid carboxyl methyltransferase 2 n=1 Tax=Impatiens glandulifera TaxID=253017 RepID=UPI001FB12B89
MANQTILHMNQGEGENSYAQNSSLQMKVMINVLPTIKEIVKDMFLNHLTTFEKLDCFKVADLGCASGPNTLLFVSEMIDIVHELCKQNNMESPEILIMLNDLHNNDFNNIFTALPLLYQQLNEKHGYEFGQRYFVYGVPGSFYGRLFPNKSLHFVHSSNSLHWLSQVPQNLDNKGHIYMTKECAPNVYKAYKNQFYKDFFSFLNKRSHEILPTGRMILTFMGRSIPDPSSNDCCCLWELLAQSLYSLLKGFIKQEEVDSFNIPIYTPYKDEVKEIIIEEKSFVLEKFEIFKCNWDYDNEEDDSINKLDNTQSGINVAKCVRSATESILVCHFGEFFLNNVFKRYAERVANHLETKKTKIINF